MPIARLKALLAPIALSLAATAGWGQCQEQRIENPAPAERANFGAGVWLEDGTLLVGGGGLHAYGFDGRAWEFEQSIPGGASTWRDRADFDGQRVIAGGSDEASIFVRRNGTFALEQRIESPDPSFRSFGESVAIEGDTAVAGQLGYLWVFRRGPDGWRQVQFLDYPSGLGLDRYGVWLELEEGWLLASASYTDVGGVSRAGVIVAYRQLPDGTFTAPQIVSVPTPGHIEEINNPVLRNGTLAVISRGVDPDGQTQVVAHTFRLDNETWVYDQAVRGSGTGDRLYATIALSPDARQMLVSDPDRGHVYAFERDASGRYLESGRIGEDSGLRFSYGGLASDGRHAYLGAPQHYSDGVAEVGAVAIVDVLCEQCTADLNGDGRADTADLLAFLNSYETGDPIADFDGDGSITPADLDVFQTALAAGCPPLPTGCLPRLIETITDFGAIGDVIVEGTMAYAHTSERGFVILDVRDPAAPVEIGRLPAFGPFDRYLVGIEKRGDTVFFFGPSGEVTAADVSDPTRPEILATATRTSGPLELVLSGDRLAVRIGPFTSLVYDVSDPASPRAISQIGSGNGLVGRDGFFFVAGGYELMAGSMWVVGPGFELLAERPLIGEGLSMALDQSGDVAYATSLNFRGSPPVGGFLTAFDVRDSTNPIELGVTTPGGRFSMVEHNGYLYAADRSGVLVYDVRDPAAMAYAQLLPYPSRDIAIIGHYLWAFGDDANLYVVDIATCLPCRADLDGDGRATVYDILAFIALYQAGSPSADFNQDGQINVVDMLGFQQAVRAGCE